MSYNTKTATNPTGYTVPITVGTKDLTEIVMDNIAYVTTQAIRGNAFTSNKFMKEYVPFLITVSAYNVALRGPILSYALASNVQPSPFVGAAGEVLILGSILWGVDSYIVSGKKKPWVEHLLDVLATRGISRELLMIGASFSVPGAADSL